MEQSGILGTGEGLGVAGALGVKEACAERGPRRRWWILVDLAGFLRGQHGATIEF